MRPLKLCLVSHVLRIYTIALYTLPGQLPPTITYQLSFHQSVCVHEEKCLPVLCVGERGHLSCFLKLDECPSHPIPYPFSTWWWQSQTPTKILRLIDIVALTHILLRRSFRKMEGGGVVRRKGRPVTANGWRHMGAPWLSVQQELFLQQQQPQPPEQETCLRTPTRSGYYVHMGWRLFMESTTYYYAIWTRRDVFWTRAAGLSSTEWHMYFMDRDKSIR